MKKLFVQFPAGTAGYGAVISDQLARRMIDANKDGVLLIHRSSDLFEVFHINRQTWRPITNAIKRHFPEAKLLQRDK